MDISQSQIVSFIWGIADDCLRDVFVRGQYRDVILPMVVLRRFDALLEPTKDDVEKVLTFNSQFHSIIYAGTKDRMIQKTLSIYQTYLKHSAPAKTYTGDYLKTILDEHKAIFDAFESKNPAAGRKAMEYHMEQSKLRRMVDYF